jgi:hypothetical protein
MTWFVVPLEFENNPLFRIRLLPFRFTRLRPSDIIQHSSLLKIPLAGYFLYYGRLIVLLVKNRLIIRMVPSGQDKIWIRAER